MEELKLTTVFYKYKSFAAWKILLYAILAIGLFFVARHSTFLLCLWAALVIAPPVLAILRNRSFFNLQSVDDRKLILTPGYVQVGTDKYEWEGIETVAIYLGGFYGFRYGHGAKRDRIMGGETPGDDNVLAFRYKGKTQSYQFFLKNFDSYVTICHIIDEWKKSGKSFVLKEQFSRDYIREQIRKLQN